MRTTKYLLAALLLAVAAAGHAVEALTTYDVVLLQPDPVMKARVSSVDAFADYIRALQLQARVPGPGASASGFIVVALRPGGQSRTWLDFDGPLGPGVGELLVRQLRAVPVPVVQGGPVVFALKVGLWGGRPSPRIAPSPPEFREASKQAGRPLEVGELVERIWNEQ